MVADTYVDEIAISRALRADRAVWANLTPHEREEALVRVRERRLAELVENAEWSRIVRLHAGHNKGGGAGTYPHRYPEWLVEVTKAAGYGDPDSLLTKARNVARARAAA
jgi:hypothetical protein